MEDGDFNSMFLDVSWPQLLIKLGGVDTIALLDTGSQVTGVSDYFYEKNHALLKHEKLPVSSMRVTKALLSRTSPIKTQISGVQLQHAIIKMNFMVIPGLNHDCNNGCDFFTNHMACQSTSWK